MNRNLLLTITSVLSIVLLTLHVVDDIVRGFDSAGLQNMIGITILALLLYGTLIFRDRLAGHVAMLLISIFAVGMPIIHLRSPRINAIAQADGGYFFVVTLWVLGVLGIFGIILAVQGILELRRRRIKAATDSSV